MKQIMQIFLEGENQTLNRVKTKNKKIKTKQDYNNKAIIFRAISRANFIPADQYGHPKNVPKKQKVKLLRLTCLFVKRKFNKTQTDFNINYPYNSKYGKTIFSFNFSFD